LSGETQLKDLEHSQVQPDLVLENLGEIVEALS
ncbi:MAG TPA: HAD family hydrolase, partial [Firmicutes bacterium]|nr:HAD family hydrolase [Bacillota bacterium]